MIFKKIRNRILLINMIMVSSVVVVAFAVVFATIYARVQNENLSKLTSALPPQPMTVSGEAIIVGGTFRIEHGFGETSVAGVSTLISPDAGLSFSLMIDSSNNVVEINSMLDMPYETYTQIARQAMESSGGDQRIKAEGRTWQFLITPVNAVYNESGGSSFSTGMVTREYNNIRFLDVTDSYRTISSLALILSGLTVVVICVFFFISRYFSNRAIRPMAEAWDKQSRFIADASHELKTPLSVINANCGVLYAGKEESVESQLKWVDSIMRAADRMSGLAENLLALASMEDRQQELNYTNFNFSTDVETAALEIEAAANEKGLSLRQDVEPDICIESDREQVLNVLSILLDNALKYTDDGGEITLCLKKVKRSIIFTVRNSGQGIPAEELPRVFDRFFRGDPARSSEKSGYGLGLSIAKAICGRLGASLSANSVPGEYTELRLVL